MDCPSNHLSEVNGNDKQAAPISTVVPSGTVPSIFLGPVTNNNQPSADCGSQTIDTPQWGSGGDVIRSRSPVSSAGSDSYKLKPSGSGHNGNSGYDSMSHGGCQPPLQNRLYPQYMQQPPQQQMPMGLRPMQNHHHHGPMSQCHPQQSMSVGSHMDRMMHGGSSAVAIATAQQMRSMVMNHYPPHGTNYPPAPGGPGSNYYQQQVASSGSGPYMDYHNAHNHHHHNGHGMSAAAAAAYAQQHHQQRLITSTAVTLNTYRQLPLHQQKVINQNQAAAYQNAYHQHQYNQYMHQQSIVTPHPHHQSMQSSSGGMMQQRILGIPISNMSQQHSYPNRSQLYSQQHNHGYSNNCQIPPLLPNFPGSSHSSQRSHPLSGCLTNNSTNLSAKSHVDSNNNSTNDKSTMRSSGVEIPGSKASQNSLEMQSKKSETSCSAKVSLLKLNVIPPEKTKLKAVRSVTKLRDRAPRLLVGHKKKSLGSGANSSRKLKSLKVLSASAATDMSTTPGQTTNNRGTGTALESGDSKGNLLRSSNLDAHDVLDGDLVTASAPTIQDKNETQILNNVCNIHGTKGEYSFRVDEGGNEYLATREEMNKYMERLNSCSTLNIPPFFAYSVFHGKLDKKKRDPGDAGDNPEDLTAAEVEWNNFQDDMAALELFFPSVSTMEQSDRAEKLDSIYSFEGQLKLMVANTNASSSVPNHANVSPCGPVDGAPCSCCYKYAHGTHPASLEPHQNEGFLVAADPTLRNNNYLRESPPQYAIDPRCHPPPHYVSTPLSSRRVYGSGIVPFYNDINGFYMKHEPNNAISRIKPLMATRKRSSSYPSRKSGRRSSGSRDHLKSETESFLDELISTANEEKNSKQRNNSGEVTAPEIQCEVDFPSLASSTAIPYGKRSVKKANVEEEMSPTEDSLASSSGVTEESESNSSGCSSSPNFMHNTSSDADFEGSNGNSMIDSGEVSSCDSKLNRSFLPPDGFDQPEQDSNDGRYSSRLDYLWEEFRGDEVVSNSPQTYEVPTQGDNLNSPSHCTCSRVESVCPTRPPPGFEHLSRPAFPIELYDPVLLCGLIGGTLSADVLSSLESSSVFQKQFLEMEEMLSSLTCCEKHAVDSILSLRRSSKGLPVGKDDEEESDDWIVLDKAINSQLDEWNDELVVHKRMHQLLFSLNLQNVYGGCCKSSDQASADQQVTYKPSEASESLKTVPVASMEGQSISRVVENVVPETAS